MFSLGCFLEDLGEQQRELPVALPWRDQEATAPDEVKEPELLIAKGGYQRAEAGIHLDWFQKVPIGDTEDKSRSQGNNLPRDKGAAEKVGGGR
ncbi:hypothetical protein [Sphingobacterium sp.]|uniref:hypothetical protein n=1 Tax=Sphingobacterium sp. TaxID=341027 RepID=UPI0028A92FD0|nr:hypothetical protein [Sphingobacterium sp.]